MCSQQRGCYVTIQQEAVHCIPVTLKCKNLCFAYTKSTRNRVGDISGGALGYNQGRVVKPKQLVEFGADKKLFCGICLSIPLYSRTLMLCCVLSEFAEGGQQGE